MLTLNKFFFVLLLTAYSALTVADTSQQTILVLGDSLSAAHNIPTETGWVTQIRQRLNDQQACDVKFVNASISGETTSGGLSRLPELLERHQPSLVILELGANDGLRGLSLKSMRNNLEQMIQLSQEISADVLLTEIRIPTNYGTRYTQRFQAIYSDLAEAYGLTLVPFFLQDIALKPELMQSDGLHPTADAQVIIVDHILPYLQPKTACAS